jgi:hypothetical protein
MNSNDINNHAMVNGAIMDLGWIGFMIAEREEPSGTAVSFRI